MSHMSFLFWLDLLGNDQIWQVPKISSCKQTKSVVSGFEGHFQDEGLTKATGATHSDFGSLLFVTNTSINIQYKKFHRIRLILL